MHPPPSENWGFMKLTDAEIKTRLRSLCFVYADVRLSDRELVQYAEHAWMEIYELEYEQAFGGWRGAHLNEETNHVDITFENAYGGPPLMVSVCRSTGKRKIDYPLNDYLLKENINITKMMRAMGMPEEECEKYRAMYLTLH